ncbi:MarR family transcriptional regulator [Haloterrigena sp. SYSU A558-1]|uniref:MarR family transcriptional regulator n=1 Tax=Haloterrigena gelatinilytica TaxID=2741724 RepID=A0ABX2LPJ5_9EURY|nr:MarR family transcriptional regulator [Haloterrigena gelatinilytica]NUC74821.1 MarR family transcriptional regulator [Haloterrigena gelatinilytica]
MLRSSELEALAAIERGDTIADLAARLEHSESYVSRVVADLAAKNLLYADRDGRRKRVRPSDGKAVAVYRDLVRQYSHIDFPELLAGKALEVCYYLDRPRTVADIAARSDNYRNTVNRVLARLRDRGLVGSDDGTYSFNGDFDRLHEFARELGHHLHRQRLEAVAPSGTILWADHDEFLAQTATEIDADGFHETGLARFAAFDLQFLLPDRRYYFYADDLESIPPADLCCHTLLIDDGTRHRSYCLLLLSRVDVDADELRDRATAYGLEDEIDALCRYLETGGGIEDDRLPDWDEFRELATDYGVAVTS